MTSIRGPSFSSTSANSDLHTDVDAGRLRARKYIFVVGGMQNLEDYQGPGNSAEVQKPATRNSLTKCAPYYFGSDMVCSSSSGMVRGSGKRMLVVRVDAFQLCHVITTLGYVAIATRFYSSIRMPIRYTIRAPASRRGALSCC